MLYLKNIVRSNGVDEDVILSSLLWHPSLSLSTSTPQPSQSGVQLGVCDIHFHSWGTQKSVHATGHTSGLRGSKAMIYVIPPTAGPISWNLRGCRHCTLAANCPLAIHGAKMSLQNHPPEKYWENPAYWTFCHVCFGTTMIVSIVCFSFYVFNFFSTPKCCGAL